MEHHPYLTPPIAEASPHGTTPPHTWKAISPRRAALLFTIAALALPLALTGGIMMLRLRRLPGPYMLLMVLGLMICILATWGLYSLYLPHPRWQRTTLHAMSLAGLAAYFAPFYDWWIHFPNSPYLATHMVMMAVCVFLLLERLNRMVQLLGEVLKDETLRTGGLAGLWICIFAGGLFILWTLISLSIYYVEYGPRVFPNFLLRDWGIPMLLPFALTTSLLLKAALRSWQCFGSPPQDTDSP